MVFKSQLCTTEKQSETLLELGLDRSTADMCHRPIVEANHKVEKLICANPPRGIDTPAWSLHRLLEILPYDITLKDYATEHQFSVVISHIKLSIELGFLKQYIRHNGNLN